MSIHPPSTFSSDTRALVLGGGGAAGNAWEIGVVAGLADAGIDLLDADLIVGTSAGATAAAQLTGGSGISALYAAARSVPAPPGPSRRNSARPDPTRPGASVRDRPMSGSSYLDWSGGIIAASSSASDMRRRIGAAALELDLDDSARWRTIVAARLASDAWPDRPVLITAIDADSGDPVVFGRGSGVGLVDAVAASTSPRTPYRIGDRRYLDGGYRRNENADLASGSRRILVLSPFSGGSRMPGEWGMDLATQAEELRAGGSLVVSLYPDAAAGDAFDARALDPATRPRAALGGFEQGRALEEELSAFWGRGS